MEEIENLIIKAEWDVTKKQWKICDIGHKRRIKYFDTRTSLLDHFGKVGWKVGAAIKMSAESDIRTEIYEYYFWRPKQK